MRGLSPIVAVVLMIGLTVSISILVTVWITNWVTFQTTNPELACALTTNYVIDSAVYTNQTNELLIRITNKAKREIYGFGVVLTNGTHAQQFNYTQVWQPETNASKPLERERTAYIKLNSSSISDTGEEFNSTFAMTVNEIIVTNEVCRAVSAKTTNIQKLI